jgi:hypothetical protein
MTERPTTTALTARPRSAHICAATPIGALPRIVGAIRPLSAAGTGATPISGCESHYKPARSALPVHRLTAVGLHRNTTGSVDRRKLVYSTPLKMGLPYEVICTTGSRGYQVRQGPTAPGRAAALGGRPPRVQRWSTASRPTRTSAPGEGSQWRRAASSRCRPIRGAYRPAQSAPWYCGGVGS